MYSEQSLPAHRWSHEQVPLEQAPFPEQELRQGSCCSRRRCNRPDTSTVLQSTCHAQCSCCNIAVWSSLLLSSLDRTSKIRFLSRKHHGPSSYSSTARANSRARCTTGYTCSHHFCQAILRKTERKFALSENIYASYISPARSQKS